MGILYLIATPIGNLADISVRAVDILRNVDLIAAEDTRHSGVLLKYYQIETKMISLHVHNEQQQSQQLVDQLLTGKSIALISDAGTPLISDPGFPLVRSARASGIKVTPVPGACAAIAALCASGLPADRFLFAGFLSAKRSARITQLQELRGQRGTLIFYESPRRVIDLFEDLQSVFGLEHQAVIARELTKQFETIYADTVFGCLQWLKEDPNHQKGEFVVLVHGAHAHEYDQIHAQKILKLLLAHMRVKDAARLAAEITGYQKNTLYELALTLV